MTGGKMGNRLRRANRDETGASAIEYALLVVAIAAIIVVILFTLGRYVNGMFQTTCSAFSSNASVGVSDSC